jgi:predicted NACHT family NTPase
MEEGLLTGKNAASLLPYITTDDIENCVDLYRLHVHQNIDEAAVAEVDELVDHHIATVRAISDGIARSVQHTIEQDAHWALTYGTR